MNLPVSILIVAAGAGPLILCLFLTQPDPGIVAAALLIAACSVVLVGGLRIARRGRGRHRAPRAVSVRSPASRGETLDVPVRQLSAYAFSSPLRMDEMLAVLDAETPWRWREGDSGWVGDYLSARVAEPNGSLRLYMEGRRFVLEMRRSALNDTVRAQVLGQVLPLLLASDIVPEEGFD